MSNSTIKKNRPQGPRKVTLKTIANHLSLTPGTVSAALNDSPAARSIPEHTKQRILAAAKELNYRPNYFARSLRLQRTYTIGVIAEEIGDAYGALVISGIEEYLRKHNFFFLTVIHRHDQKLLHTYAQMLLARGVEGFITADTTIKEKWNVPTVAVANHERVEGVTNIVLDHQLAARLALSHLAKLGHKEIAFLKGSVLSADAEDRWKAIREVADEMGIKIHPELVVQIDSTDSTPRLGYPFAKKLLERKKPFTALLAYNDISAIGAIWAFQEAGLVVPRDISVVGFDDIPSAAFNSPGLTTVRQPLQRMGNIAAKTVIDQIEGHGEYVGEIFIEPEFVVRASTGPAPGVAVMSNLSGKSTSSMEREGEIASAD
ncbi:MAG TPA: LacI family DNA-binding transcriptional regulator [Candidatus Acidoferrum sp.]|jgi:LacI family transcriptional regulator|nr:LacI family DNA-binding transcriptional regulator [Candidatus Acidoferrum sp.]